MPPQAWNEPPETTAGESGGMEQESPVLASEYIVRGRVLDSQRRPVPEAVVIATNAPGTEKNCGTDKEGRFKLSLAAAGRWSFLVESEGYVPWEADVEVVREATEVDVMLTQYGTLSGEVDTGGVDAQYFQVVGESVEHPGQQVTASCGDSGRFVYKEVTPGQYDVHLSYGTIHFPPQMRVMVLAGQRVEVQLRGPPTGNVTGLAVLPAGVAVPPMGKLELTELSTYQRTEHTVKFREDASFQITGIPAGSYQATLEIPGLARIPPRELTVGPPWHTSVEFTWPDGMIEGHVGGGPSGPAVRTHVILQRLLGSSEGMGAPDPIPAQTSETDDNGYFVFNGLSAGRYIVRAQGELGTDALEAEITEGSDRQYVSLWVEAGQIAMTIRVLHEGSPMRGVSVMALRLPYAEGGESSVTDDRGEAHFASLKPGTYYVVARYPIPTGNLLLTGGTQVSIAPGGAPAPVTLNLQ